MAHTIWGGMIRSIVVDGKEMGEGGINAKLAQEYGVPVILASGDDLLKDQLEEEVEDPVFYVETKKVINSQSALCCSWDTLEKRYESAIRRAVHGPKKKGEPKPHTMEITFHHERNADFAARMDGVERVDACTVRIQKEDFDTLYRYMRFVIKTCNAFAG